LYIKTFNFYKTALLHCYQQSGAYRRKPALQRRIVRAAFGAQR